MAMVKIISGKLGKSNIFSKKNKEDILRLPVITLLKERVKLDKSVHLWTSQDQKQEKVLMERTSQDDPTVSFDILTYGNDDWIETIHDDKIKNHVQEENEDQEEPISPSIWKINQKNKTCI
jgi:hypothetical protein